MSEKILCVDDDPSILQAYQRALRKNFSIDAALGGEEALAAIEKNSPYAVVVADMRMPGMSGVEVLARIRAISPDTVRMMLTGNADQQTAMEAVNEGHIFRFMTKPCRPEIFAKALEAGIEQHRLVTAERELLSKTLGGSVKLLTDMLGFVNPAAFGRASRVQRLAHRLCAEMTVCSCWPTELAAMLSQLGCVTIPQDTLTKIYRGDHVSEEAREAFREHPKIGRDLLIHIPRLEQVAEIVGYQEKHYDGEGFPSDYRRGEEIPQGSRILKAALDWDSLLMASLPEEMSMAKMFERRGWYDPAVLQALKALYQIEEVLTIRKLQVSDLQDGMIIAEDIRSLRNTLLCTKGQEVTMAVRLQLRNYIVNVGLSGPVKVFAPLADAESSGGDGEVESLVNHLS